MTGEFPIAISISRQFGSGGGTIGKNIAKQLKFLFLDREIVIEAAQKLGSQPEEIEENDERTLSGWQSFLQSFQYADPNYVPMPMTPSDREIYETEAEIILKIANEKSVVVVGRGSPHILKDHPNHLSVFLHANMAFRQQNVRALYHLSEREAQDLIHETDKARERHINKFTGQNMYDLRNYNLVIDSGLVGLDQAEKIMMEYIQSRFYR